MRFPALYLAAIILTANAGFLVGSDAYGLTTRSSVVVLQLFLWMAGCAYLATLEDRLSKYPDAEDVLAMTGVMLIASAPFARVVWVTQHDQNPSWSLAAIVVVGLFLVSMHLTDKATPLEFVAAYWAVVTSLLQMGQTDFLPYAREAVRAMRALHDALDLRIVTTAIFVGILFTRAILEAVERGRPDIDDLPLLHVPPPDPDWHPLLTAVAAPFLYIADAIFRALQVVANLLWKLVATVAVFFYRIGEELITTVIANLLTERLVVAVARTMGTVLLTFVSLMILFGAAPLVPKYIGNTQWLHQVLPLLGILALLFFAAMTITSISWATGEHKTRELWMMTPFVVSNFVAVVFVAGLVLFILARVDRFQLAAFRGFGVFSALLIAVMAMAIPVWIAKGSRKAPPVGTRAASSGRAA